jgi:hypothetical protein
MMDYLNLQTKQAIISYIYIYIYIECTVMFHNIIFFLKVTVEFFPHYDYEERAFHKKVSLRFHVQYNVTCFLYH